MSGIHLHYLAAALAACTLLSGCQKPKPDVAQGYVEGEYVYVASPLGGTLETLAVQRGAQIKAGDPLFALESESETAAVTIATKRIEEARAHFADAKKGKRPEEIQAIEAQLDQARAALALSEKEFGRQSSLYGTGASSGQEMDRIKATREQDRQRVTQLDADLKTAKLGLRPDQIAAAEANVQALEASLAKAQWDLDQKRRSAPQTGLVFDTLYRTGEWIAAGKPVVSLLPPENVKVRAFIPEPRLATIHRGDALSVEVDGVVSPLRGKVSFISPQAEYTPPVIYSQDTRGKLVYMIELTFDPAVAARLHPGQPVTVRFAANP